MTTDWDIEQALRASLDASTSEGSPFIEALAEATGNDELCVDTVRTLEDGGWMTSQHGVELRLSDGTRFLLTVERAR